MDVPPVPQIHGHMAGEEEQISGTHLLPGDGPDGVALLDGRVPPDDHPAEQIGHGAQTGAVDAHGGLAAPAVGGAPVGQGAPHQGGAHGRLVLMDGRGVVLPQNAAAEIPLLPAGEQHPLPAIPLFPARGHDIPPDQGRRRPGRHVGEGQHVAGPPEHHLLLPARPALRCLLAEEEALLRSIAGVAVVGAHQLPGGPRVLQHLHNHAPQGLVRPPAPAGRPAHQRADGGCHNRSHHSPSPLRAAARGPSLYGYEGSTDSMPCKAAQIRTKMIQNFPFYYPVLLGRDVKIWYASEKSALSYIFCAIMVWKGGMRHGERRESKAQAAAAGAGPAP